MNEDRTIDDCTACDTKAKLDWNKNLDHPRFRVQCTGCGMETKFYKTMEEAETAWGSKIGKPLYMVADNTPQLTH